MFKKKNYKQEIALIKIDEIDINPYHTRKQFNQEELIEMAQSILEIGIIEPIIVKQVKRKRYQLISGLRRIKAAKIAQIEIIPAKLVVANETDIALMVLTENIYAKKYDVTEKAEAIKMLNEQFHLQMKDISAQTGISTHEVYKLMQIANLDNYIKDYLYKKKCPEKWLNQIIKIRHNANQDQIIEQTIKHNLNLEDFTYLIEQAMLQLQKDNDQQGQHIIRCITTNKLFINSIKSTVNELKECGYKTFINEEYTEEDVKINITISNKAVNKNIS